MSKRQGASKHAQIPAYVLHPQSIINILHQWGTFITIDVNIDPLLLTKVHSLHQDLLSCCRSRGFTPCIMTCSTATVSYRIVSVALEILCSPPALPALPRQLLIFLLSPLLCLFQNVMQLESYSIYPFLDWLLSLGNMLLWSLKSLHGLIAYFITE